MFVDPRPPNISDRNWGMGEAATNQNAFVGSLTRTQPLVIRVWGGVIMAPTARQMQDPRTFFILVAVRSKPRPNPTITPEGLGGTQGVPYPALADRPDFAN